MVRNGTIITPGFEQDILEGITRDSVINIAKDFGIPVLERSIDKTELLIADEVFLCGTAARVTPVKRIENYRLPESRSITEKIRNKLIEITENREDKYQDWVYKISID
jgi:branched-chain amino acid aminotransferase